jgi:hypothetical protein
VRIQQVNEQRERTIDPMKGINRYASHDDVLTGRSCSMYLIIQAAMLMRVMKVLKELISILGISKAIRIGSKRRKQQIASIHVLLQP